MFFLDYLLNRYDPALASNVRKGADGIGWIFQFGMGYTFYLPFALYMAGLLCWSYTVIRLLTMGRLAGYGLGLMFIAGYALLYSNLTLMVVSGCDVADDGSLPARGSRLSCGIRQAGDGHV